MKAMIFAAGLGTRLKPYTDHTPKAMVKIKGKPLLEWKIEWLQKWGFNEIIVNVHHFSDQVKSFLNHYHKPGLQIAISDESDFLLETGGGLKKAKPLLIGEEPFLVVNVDILSNINLKDFYQSHLNGKALATLAVRNRNTSRYFVFNDNDELCGWKNVKTGEERWSRKTDEGNVLAFSGMHIISPQIFDLMEEEGAFSIVDVYLRLAQNHLIKAFRHDESIWIDVGKPHHLAEAEKFIDQL
ncbi:MAG: nucleotidyltransferase family protein [Bacteroidetes bacterium]|nr:nucleotidyltransferase family protein [Bacteroidota bacterium]MCB0842428.1 nucleotidyltransferase family protein [Bacteroidota bacterium]